MSRIKLYGTLKSKDEIFHFEAVGIYQVQRQLLTARNSHEKTKYFLNLKEKSFQKETSDSIIALFFASKKQSYYVDKKTGYTCMLSLKTQNIHCQEKGLSVCYQIMGTDESKELEISWEDVT